MTSNTPVPADAPQETAIVDDEPPASSEGPVIALTKGWRIAFAIGALGIAAGRAIWPTFPIDTLGLGLLALAILLLFFDIERIELGGVTASRQKARLKKAAQELTATDVPEEPVEVGPVPEPGAMEDETAVRGYGGLVHRKPFDLMPPTNPAERVLWGAEKVRVELIVLAGNSGHLPYKAEWSEYDAETLARHLSNKNILPRAIEEGTSLLVEARRQLINGALRGGALTSADSLAMELLQKLREVKRQYVRVREPDVTLFRDQSLSTLYQETAGVMLVTLDERGKILHTSVFPRLFNYAKGRFVSWEWNMERGFDDEAWYHDPITGTAKMAFSESLTFAGREYPQQWGLEYNLARPVAGLD